MALWIYYDAGVKSPFALFMMLTHGYARKLLLPHVRAGHKFQILFVQAQSDLYLLTLASYYETTEYLEKFLRNLLQGEKNALHNREMHVSGKFVVEDDPIKRPDKSRGI